MQGRIRLFVAQLALPALLGWGCTSTNPIAKYLPRPEVKIRDATSAEEEAENLADQYLYPTEPARAELMVEVTPGTFTKYIPTKPGSAEKLKTLALAHIGGKIDSIKDFDKNVRQGNSKTDLLLVTGNLDEIRRVENFLESIEALAPQIEIEAKVVEINSDSDTQIGLRTTIEETIERAGGTGGSDATLFRRFDGIFDAADFAESQTSQRDFQGNLLTLQGLHDEILVNFIVQALVKEGYAELISSPTITALDGCEAEIITGDEVPVQKTRVQAGVTFVDIEYKKTGVKLKVTPNIVGEDSIQLVVASEVSTVIGFTPAVQGSFPVPIISNRNASTVVNIKSGSTFVIGGLISDIEIEDVLKTPFLGDLPLLKYLFRVKRTRKSRSQVLFFLTPRIVLPGSSTPSILSPQTR